jgi:catechol-2,3-dioxygenase
MKPLHALAAAAIALACSGSALAQPPAALPEALKPTQMAGSGLNVMDLEAQKAWYQAMLGMKLVQTYSRNGAPFEYIMKMSAEPNSPGAVLALLKTTRPAGPNGFGRLIFNAPDAKVLAARLASQGVVTREVIAGAAYFVTDPEGNAIELYTPPKP